MYCFKCGSLLRDGAFFRGNCGTLRKNIIHDPNGSLNSLLDACHDIQISLRILKSKLKTMQLTKSPNITDEAVRQTIKR